MSENVKGTKSKSNKGKGTAPIPTGTVRPFPFTKDRPTITFVVWGLVPGSRRLVVKNIYRNFSPADADKVFPLAETGPAAGEYSFGRCVYRLRSIKEVAEIAEVDPATARDYLAVDPVSNQPVNPVEFAKFCLDSLYRMKKAEESIPLPQKEAA